ncbi:MAG: amidase [Proteobacteria bacterium]|nr:amidase [Pseudomonadota bacterium]
MSAEFQTSPIRRRLEGVFERAGAPSAEGVFTELFEAGAHEQAGRVEARLASGRARALDGLLIGVKDNIDVAGFVTRAGSKALEGRAPAARDAPAVAQARDAGGILVGHNNMTELAFSGLGLNPAYGTPRNPAFEGAAHIPGGSSSGGAVAVALDLCDAAIGTDTGGSVRIPAAFCGLVGFKPTASTVSREGVVPLSTTLDSVGVMARSVGVCRQVYQVIRTARPEAGPTPTRAGRVRIGVLRNYVRDDISTAVDEAIGRALDRLSSARDVDLIDCAFAPFDRLPAIQRAGSFSAAESFFNFRELVDDKASPLDPRVRQRMEIGRAMSAADYLALRAARAEMIAAFADWFPAFDVVAMPTTPITAPRLADLAEDAAWTRANLLALRNPTTVNFVDGCAVSLPCHRAGEPPVGLSLAAPGGHDHRLLDIADRLAPLLT